MRELLEAGVHFGHQTRRWNPKMRRYIFGERGGIYIIDLTKTLELLEESYEFVRNVADRGGTILFVGTKKQAQDAVSEHAQRVGMPYVNHRWLGGLLTNWRFISATPPRFASSFSRSASIPIRSFDGSSSSWPSAFRRRRSWRYAMRSEIVRQFVSRPPSQRWFT